jgi:limonene-1,2-epoxide hydrolase
MNAHLDPQDACERRVRDFLSAWTGRDIDALCSYFAADAVYHNVPVAPITGIAGIRQIFVAFLEAFEAASLDVVSLAAAPGLVIAERIDRFTMRNGIRVVLPVTGVFELRGGRITRFSDYFDLADFERQSGLKL